MADPIGFATGVDSGEAQQQAAQLHAIAMQNNSALARQNQAKASTDEMQLREAQRYQQFQQQRQAQQRQQAAQPQGQGGQAPQGQQIDPLSMMERFVNNTANQAADEASNGFTVQSDANMKKASEMMSKISQARKEQSIAQENNIKAEIGKTDYLARQLEVVKSFAPELRPHYFELAKKDYESKFGQIPAQLAQLPYSDKLVDALQNASLGQKEKLHAQAEASRVKSENANRASEMQHRAILNRKELADAKIAEERLADIKKNGGQYGKDAVVGLTGENYLKTLSATDAANVKYISEGRGSLNEISSRLAKGSSKSERDRIAEMVKNYNPQFNSGDAKESVATRIAFDKGKQGDKVRSLNVSINHLDTLGELHDALQSGNVQRINQAKNLFKKEFGAEAPTNYAAASDLIADEVVSAIVPGSGSLSDREAGKEKIKAELSNGQAKGVVETYHKLLGGQLSGLEQQYKAGVKGATEDDFREKYLTGRSKELLGKDKVSSEDKQAVAWAKANPNDPRAVKIMEHNHGL